MPLETKQAFLEAFGQLPKLLFIWKYECLEEDIAANYSNVIIDKWWPQSDILNHPNLLTFITHGGSGSISESIHAGVSPIVVPLFADQVRNSKMIEFRETGISLSKFELTTDNIVSALNRILNDKRLVSLKRSYNIEKYDDIKNIPI
jgi:UDP:flavonoid glycosyltransferase YjiC (YdhE family)